MIHITNLLEILPFELFYYLLNLLYLKFLSTNFSASSIASLCDLKGSRDNEAGVRELEHDASPALAEYNLVVGHLPGLIAMA